MFFNLAEIEKEGRIFRKIEIITSTLWNFFDWAQILYENESNAEVWAYKNGQWATLPTTNDQFEPCFDPHGENFMEIFTTLSTVIWFSTGTLGIFAILVYVFTKRVVIYDIYCVWQ